VWRLNNPDICDYLGGVRQVLDGFNDVIKITNQDMLANRGHSRDKQIVSRIARDGDYSHFIHDLKWFVRVTYLRGAHFKGLAGLIAFFKSGSNFLMSKLRSSSRSFSSSARSLSLIGFFGFTPVF